MRRSFALCNSVVRYAMCVEQCRVAFVLLGDGEMAEGSVWGLHSFQRIINSVILSLLWREIGYKLLIQRMLS